MLDHLLPSLDSKSENLIEHFFLYPNYTVKSCSISNDLSSSCIILKVDTTRNKLLSSLSMTCISHHWISDYITLNMLKHTKLMKYLMRWVFLYWILIFTNPSQMLLKLRYYCTMMPWKLSVGKLSLTLLHMKLLIALECQSSYV